MLAPAGTVPARGDGIGWGGRSPGGGGGVNVSAASSAMLAEAGTPASTGAWFTSVTWIVIVSEAPSCGVPSSFTRTVTRLSLGPCASVGVQVKTPVVVLMLAPVGAPGSSENVRLWAGRFASVAEAVNVSVEPSATDLLPIAARTGATFTSRISKPASLASLAALPA